MQLYTAVISPNGKRVRICAEELGVALDPVLLDFQKGEPRKPEYLAKNPMGKIPTLTDGDLVLWESAAILCYLARKAGGSLWPAGPREEADLLRWLFYCSCHIDPYFTTLVVERFIKARRGAAPDEALTASAEQWLARFLPVVDQQLAEREYVTGTFGLADIALGCSLELSPMVRYDLSPYPHVRAWLDRLHARESWKRCS
jgi:glutathione S-transferase